MQGILITTLNGQITYTYRGLKMEGNITKNLMKMLILYINNPLMNWMGSFKDVYKDLT